MIRIKSKIWYAGLLLLILISAHAGQTIHIYNEDPLHYEAFSGDLLPGNGATSKVIARCIVDNFYFFPGLNAEKQFPIVGFKILRIESCFITSGKLAETLLCSQLRAPPAA